MIIRIFTDGGALGNPGPAASAYLIYADDNALAKGSKHLGRATNNQAEYTALILAFEKLKKLLEDGLLEKPSKIEVVSDSKLMISQLNGLYKVKNADIRDNVLRIRMLENELNAPISYAHVYREENEEADALVKEALENSSKF